MPTQDVKSHKCNVLWDWYMSLYYELSCSYVVIVRNLYVSFLCRLCAKCQFTDVKWNTDLYGVIYIFLYVLSDDLMLPLIQICHDSCDLRTRKGREVCWISRKYSVKKKKLRILCQKKVAGKISVWCHTVLKRVCPEFWKFICEESLIKKITTYITITDSYKICLQCYHWWHLSLRIILIKLHYFRGMEKIT